MGRCNGCLEKSCLIIFFLSFPSLVHSTLTHSIFRTDAKKRATPVWNLHRFSIETRPDRPRSLAHLSQEDDGFNSNSVAVVVPWCCLLMGVKGQIGKLNVKGW